MKSWCICWGTFPSEAWVYFDWSSSKCSILRIQSLCVCFTNEAPRGEVATTLKFQQLRVGRTLKRLLGGGSLSPFPAFTWAPSGKSTSDTPLTAHTWEGVWLPWRTRDVQERRYTFDVPLSPLKLYATFSPSPCSVFVLQEWGSNLGPQES